MRGVFVALVFVVACDSAVQPPSMLEVPDAGEATPSDADGSAGAELADASEPPDSGVDPWAPVETLLDARRGDVELGLVVFDQNDQRVFEKMYGGFTSDRNIAVASASKMISGLVIFALIDRG